MVKDLRQAAQQALRKLEKARVTIDSEWGHCRELEEIEADGDQWQEVIDLRTALAEQPSSKPWVELTDEEIDALPWEPSYDNPMTLTEGLRDFARAVIKAYKTKQGEQT